MYDVAVYSGKRKSSSWGGRHALTWRQLSVFWNLKVQYNLTKYLTTPPLTTTRAYSLAISPNEFTDLTGLTDYYNAGPVVAFLDRSSLSFQKSIISKEIPVNTSYDQFRNIFHVNSTSSLTRGLPDEVIVYGSLDNITTISIDPPGKILVSLDGKPIIVYYHPHLIIGADAWQLGAPSVPLVYPILFNWLRFVVGCEINTLFPHAIIRIDDLPTTAAELLNQDPTPHLDRRRATSIRRIRKFAKKIGGMFNLMYTSHFFTRDGNLQPIGDVMPNSIKEMRLGINQGVFEIGAHGMVHLRYSRSEAISAPDPQEFLDLDEQETKEHLNVCIREIRRLFKKQPTSFVAPAWGYQPTITEKVAGQLFNVVIDSSQHIENGLSEVFGIRSDEVQYFNCPETFRFSNRMLSFSTSNFWRCYAIAGIPVHYMQHSDYNWTLIKEFLSKEVSSINIKPNLFWTNLSLSFQNPNNPLILRIVSVFILMVVIVLRKPNSCWNLWKLLSRSSLYSIVKALTSAGYQCVGFENINDQYLNLKDENLHS